MKDLKLRIDTIFSSSETRDEKLEKVCKLLKDEVTHYNWVGFYFNNGDKAELKLGPFSGAPTDHVIIPFGKGICGQVAVSNETFVVPDVNAQDNYLACSIETKSEIVVPIFKDGKNIGQIDIDSHQTDPFTEKDEDLLSYVCEKSKRNLLMEEILKYFPNLTEKQKLQFSQLKPLYAEWNEKINVISRKDIDELYVRHVLHSLAIAKTVEFKDGADILDVGTGGGFPGIPLAILFPKVNFHLVDSIQKKILVVNEVAHSLGLENVKAEAVRAEKIKSKYDFVVSRAVTQMPKFVGWVRNKIKKENNHQLPNGILYLKGGDLTEELKDFGKVRIFNLSDYFSYEFFETKKLVWLAL